MGLVPYVRSAGWMWVFLYAYSLRIYLDFSGYTDVAIGIGRMLGVRLPENFAAPYLKSNIALVLEFLAHDADAVVPVVRLQSHSHAACARQRRRLPTWLIILDDPGLDDGAHRPVARNHLELRRLGPLARHRACSSTIDG